MIIPVKCFTCGKVLADKYQYYQKTVAEMKLKNKDYNHPNKLYHYHHIFF